MHPARYLLLLNLKSPSWTTTASSHKSWCWEDIAAALSMGKLPDLAATLARAKYCEDVRCRQQLVQQVRLLVRDYSSQSGWRCQAGQLNKLAQLACYEMLSAHRCPKCEGRGCTVQGLECTECRGHGRQPMKAAQRYRYAGIDKRSWERRWHTRYETVYRSLCDAENQLLDHLSWQLNG